MIIRENRTIDGRNFVYTYSDEGFMIECDGIIYCDVYDPIEYAEQRIYTETNIKREDELEQEEGITDD